MSNQFAVLLIFAWFVHCQGNIWDNIISQDRAPQIQFGKDLSFKFHHEGGNLTRVPSDVTIDLELHYSQSKQMIISELKINSPRFLSLALLSGQIKYINGVTVTIIVDYNTKSFAIYNPQSNQCLHQVFNKTLPNVTSSLIDDQQMFSQSQSQKMPEMELLWQIFAFYAGIDQDGNYSFEISEMLQEFIGQKIEQQNQAEEISLIRQFSNQIKQYKYNWFLLFKPLINNSAQQQSQEQLDIRDLQKLEIRDVNDKSVFVFNSSNLINDDDGQAESIKHVEISQDCQEFDVSKMNQIKSKLNLLIESGIIKQFLEEEILKDDQLLSILDILKNIIQI